jgi:peptidoglycan/xylan/chitin deacetylase (PgdA/CDA1 family)
MAAAAANRLLEVVVVRRASVGLLIVLVGVAAVLLLGHGETPQRRIAVEVAGRSVQVPPGTTVAAAAARLGLRPRAGDLIGLDGNVLRTAVFRGSFLVNDRPARSGELLHAGDGVSVVNGRNREEPRVREIVKVRGGVPSDPQFFVDRVPGNEVLVRGRVSHALVSASFAATGGPRPSRAVALTFDDGPSPQFTAPILRTLVRLRVHATFFVIGYLAADYPDLVRREAQLGMTIGNHSYNHPQVPPFAQLPAPLMRDEIALAAHVLERIRIKTHLFRPPGGSNSPQLLRATAALGERIVLWSIDPRDWAPGTTAGQISKRVLSALRPGAIIELHDGGGDRSATLAALPAIIRGIRARGLRLVTLSPGTQPIAITGPGGG